MVARQTDKDETTTRVYKYGIVPLGPFPEEGIEELWRVNNLWNKLVEIDRDARRIYDQARRDALPDYGVVADHLHEINEEIKTANDAKRALRAETGTKDPDNPLNKEAERQIKVLKAKRKDYFEKKFKPIRSKADKVVDKKQLNQDANSRKNQVKRDSGLYNVTADAVMEYFKTARDRAFKSHSTLRFHRFDGSGFFHYRFRRAGAKIDGVTFNELFLGNKDESKSQKRLLFISHDATSKKSKIRMRATLAGNRKIASKIMHYFDLVYHRPIPKDGQIQNAKIVRTRTGDRFTYHIVFTVKFPKKPLLDVPTDTAIGIDLNFRKSEESVQVAAILHLKSDEYQEIFAPKEMVKVAEHIECLKAHIDDEATDLGKVLKPMLKKFNENHPNFEVWQHKFKLWKALLAFNNVTLSAESAYKIARWILWDPGHLDSEIEKLVLKWWQCNSRKYREHHNLRKKQLLNRKHFYRQIASELVAHKELIVFENFDLRDIVETKNKDTRLTNKARYQRFCVSPSEFRNVVTSAAERENVPHLKVNAAYTSKDCSFCGYRNKSLGSEKEWRCPKCGEAHDRDINAARNIAKRGLKKYLKQ